MQLFRIDPSHPRISLDIKYQSQLFLFAIALSTLLCTQLVEPSTDRDRYEKKFSLAPVAPRLSELLKQEVPLIPDCIGMAVGKAVVNMKDGDVVLLENSRFYPEEEKNDPAFCADLAKQVNTRSLIEYITHLPDEESSSSQPPSPLPLL